MVSYGYDSFGKEDVSDGKDLSLSTGLERLSCTFQETAVIGGEENAYDSCCGG